MGVDTSDAAGRARYVIDAGASRFAIQAFSGGLLAALGHNPKFVARDFGGEVSFDPRPSNDASLTLTVRAASLVLADEVSEKDREMILRTMHDEVLESATYPTITYQCPRAAPQAIGTGQFEVTLGGELTLHGVTRRLPIATRLTASEGTLRAIGEFPVRQTDFGIKLVTVAGSMLKVKDELKCTFEIVARR